MRRLVRWRIKTRKTRRASLLHRWLSQAHVKIGTVELCWPLASRQLVEPDQALEDGLSSGSSSSDDATPEA